MKILYNMEDKYFNKYSQKIITFVNDNINLLPLELLNFLKRETNNLSKLTFVQELVDIVANTSNNNYTIKERKKTPKINNPDDKPLMYMFLKHYYDKSFSDFIEWFRENQSDINIEKFKQNNENKILYEIINKSNNERKHLHKLLYKNRFVPIDVQHHAESSELIYSLIKLEDGAIIHLYEIAEDDEPLNLNQILHAYFLVKEFALKHKYKISSEIPKPIFTIFAGKQRKQFTFNKVLCPDNINSGSTYPTISIDLWRKEEITKVLIHELVHFYEFDYNVFDKYADSINDFVNSKIKIDGKDYQNETFTEMLALIIHSVFISHYTNIPFEQLFLYEIIHTIYQVKKILGFFGYNEFKEQISFKQTTSVYSYFINKLLIMLNLDKYMQFIKNNLIIKTTANKYLDFLRSIYNKSTYDKLNKAIRAFDGVNNKSEFIKTNLRMSVYNLNSSDYK